MTTAAWPTSLSSKLLAVAGYSEDVTVDPTIRSTQDSGPPKFRARFTAVPESITGVIDTLSSTDVDNLITFYRTTLVWGTQPFTWVHPRTQDAVTFYFLKYPKVSPAAGSPITFQAEMNLMILPT